MDDKLKKEVIKTLQSLKKDAQMAIDGEWDCTTEEGIETGFSAQIEQIDKILTKLKK